MSAPIPRIIVVATDFSDCADVATAHAIALAKKLDARVRLVHAWMIPIVTSPEYAVPLPAGFIDDLARQAQAAMDAALKRHQTPGTEVTGTVLCGDARDVVSEEAAKLKADWVVVGTHSRRGLRRLVLGSVAEAIVRSAPCPVLVVR